MHRIRDLKERAYERVLLVCGAPHQATTDDDLEVTNPLEERSAWNVRCGALRERAEAFTARDEHEQGLAAAGTSTNLRVFLEKA